MITFAERRRRRRTFRSRQERPPNAQDLFIAFDRYCNHEQGETPAARRIDAMAAYIIERGMAGDYEYQQLAAEVRARGTRL
jgi:hypothetical protein